MKTFAYIISHVLQPLFIPLYGMILFFYASPFAVLPVSVVYKWVAIGGTFFFTAVIPGLSILYMIRLGQVSNLFISQRSQRTMPYLYTLVAYLFWIYFLWQVLNFPMIIVWIAIGSTLSLVLIMLINRWWKVSAHLSSMGGLTGAVFGVCYVCFVNALWVFVGCVMLAGLVMLARVILRGHTPLQTVVGFYIGLFSTFLPCVLYR